MGRTEGTMKVVVFERTLPLVDNSMEMRSAAAMLGEAAEWIRNEMVREVRISAKQSGPHRIWNISTNWEIEAFFEGGSSEHVGDAMRLYLHYDDNEKG